MIDFKMIEKIEEWGFEIGKEYWYHVSYKLYHEDAIKLCMFNEYLGDDFEKYLKDNDIELENEPFYIGDYKIYTTYKLYHVYAEELTTFSDYLADEFEKYLKDNEIEPENWQPSDLEEFFEQYGIEVY